MSSSIDGRTTDEYAGVTVLAGHFLALHVKGQVKSFISKYPTNDIKVAAAAAKAFAETHQIRLNWGLLIPDKFFLTIMKENNMWYPAEIHWNRITLVKAMGEHDLGSDKDGAIRLVSAMAMGIKTDLIPEIGISITESMEQAARDASLI
jgi:hypothetical protein